MPECLHPDCDRVFDSRQGRSFHFGQHDDAEEIALQILSNSNGVKYENCSEKVGLSAHFYENHFGSWNNALRKSGKETNLLRDVPDNVLLEEIRKMSEDDVVRYDEMDENGKFSARVYEIRFGSWDEAIIQAGYDKWDRTGKDNPCWKGGHDKYRGESWKDARQKTRERAENTCEHPDCTINKESLGKHLDTHHIVPFRYFNSHKRANKLSNLVLLCPDHHREEETRIWRIERIDSNN